MTRRWRTEYGIHEKGEEPEGWEEWRLRECARVRAWQKEHPGYHKRDDTSIPVLPADVLAALDRWSKAVLVRVNNPTCSVDLRDLYYHAGLALRRVDGIDLDLYLKNRGLAKYLRHKGFTSSRRGRGVVFIGLELRNH